MIDLYALEPPRELPMLGFKTLIWHTTASLLPQPDQRVIWSGRGGRQQHGLYQGGDRWLADPDDQHREPWRYPEQPGIWRPEPCNTSSQP